MLFDAAGSGIVCNGVCRCWRWNSFCKVFLLFITCVTGSTQDYTNEIKVNTSSSIIDMANYTSILLIMECPQQYDYIGWYHDGKGLEDRGRDGRSLLHVVEHLEDGGIFKCGFANDPLDTWSIINITIGRKPSRPQNLVCTGHLYDQASCTWQHGSQQTNLPGWFIAQRKIQNKWITCNYLTDNVCEIYNTDGLRAAIRVSAVNELGSSDFAEVDYRIDKDVRLLPPTDLILKHSSENKISATWGAPEGWQDKPYSVRYYLRYRHMSSYSDWTEITIEEFLYVHDFVGWDIYTTYEVQVRAKRYNADEPGIWSESVNITTNEEHPVGQLIVSYTETESDDKNKETYRNILLTWEVPDVMKARGKILGFEIKLLKLGAHEVTLNLTDGSASNHTLKNLLRDANYTVYMSAYNSVSISTPYILNIAPSPANIQMSAIITAVMVSIVIVVILLTLGIVWLRIKKTDICLPLPEPNFNILKWKSMPNSKAYVEDEVFDEIKQRRAVPTKYELDKLMKKLPDPALKDVILDLLISKYSIDYDWQRMEKRRMSRLLSNNTEISFLSADDEEEHLISNLGSLSGCRNTRLLNLANCQGPASGGLTRIHSLPIIDGKYTKNFNVKEEAFTSDSGDTSGIGSESSDHDIESECHMMTCHSVQDVNCITPPFASLGKPGSTSGKPSATSGKPSATSGKPCATPDNPTIISPYTEPAKIPNVSAKNHNDVRGRCGYITPKDFAKVFQPPPNQPPPNLPRNLQKTTQSGVSEYLDPAQMRCLGTHQRKFKYINKHMKKKPKASDNGYVDPKDMPKFVSHRPKIPAENIPKSSVYVQHEELPALLTCIKSSKPTNPPFPVVDSNVVKLSSVHNNNNKQDKQTKTSKECHNSENKNQDMLSNISPYVEGASKTSVDNKSIMFPNIPSQNSKSIPDDASVLEKQVNASNNTQTNPDSTRSLADVSVLDQPISDYVSFDEVEKMHKDTSVKTYTGQKLSQLSKGSLSHSLAERDTPTNTSSGTSNLQNTSRSGLPKKLLHSSSVSLQNTGALLNSGSTSECRDSLNMSSSGLSRPRQSCGTPDTLKTNRSISPNKCTIIGCANLHNINGSALPKQTISCDTSSSQTINSSILPKQSLPTRTIESQNTNGSGLPTSLPTLISGSQNISGGSLEKQGKLPEIATQNNIRGIALPKKGSPTGTVGTQNTSDSSLPIQGKLNGSFATQYISSSILPSPQPKTSGNILQKQTAPGTSMSRNISDGALSRPRTWGASNISGNALVKENLSAGIPSVQTTSGSVLPKQNIQLRNPKVDQDGYIPIRSMANAATSNPVSRQPQKNQLQPKSRSHFQNQGRMMKGQFKSAKVIYKVSPSL